MANPSPKVEQHEVEALLGRAEGSAAPEVAPCDFARPRRLGPERIEALRAELQVGLKEAAEALGEALGAPAELELVDLSETHADAIFRSVPEPLLALRFALDGQPCWLVWSVEPAIACVERVLGGTNSKKASRALSPIEARVLSGFLASLLEPLLRGLGLAPGEPSVVQDPAELGTWRDATGEGDPHRLAIEIDLSGVAGDSSLHLYLAGFPGGTGRESAARGALPAAVPRHLRHVGVELRVELSGAEIPLSQLLGLEEGDVIPIEARVGDPARAEVDGRTVATGVWGTHEGRLALRIDRLVSEEDPQG